MDRLSTKSALRSRAGGQWIAALVALSLVTCIAASRTQAEDYGGIAYTSVQGQFADVQLGVENAIINRGLVVDYRGHFGKMLERTGSAVGSAEQVYTHAEWLQFCSATLSRAMVEADPRNLGFCPYTIVLYELAAQPGTVQIGYRVPGKAGDAASMKALGAIDALLAGIVAEAAE